MWTGLSEIVLNSLQPPLPRNPLNTLLTYRASSATFALLAMTTLAVLTGCATRPESIPASYISHEKYTSNSCTELSANMADARAQLTKFSDMQNSKANIDAATVFLVLIPASKLSGDSAADVAKYKGEVEAIETAQIKNGCKKSG